MVFLWLFCAAFAGLMWGIFIALASEPARWWEIMTAIGTVGATVAASWVAASSFLSGRSVRVKRLASMLCMVDEAVQAAEWIARHLLALRDAPDDIGEVLSVSKNELAAFLASMDAIDKIPFYEPDFSDGHLVLLPVLGALKSTRPLVEQIILDESKMDTVRASIVSLSKTAKDELEAAAAKKPLTRLRRPGRLYF